MKTIKLVSGFSVMALLLTLVMSAPADARFGGGRSSGFRGSRSLSAPRSYRPSYSNPSYSNPTRDYRTSPQAQPAPTVNRPSFGGSFARGILGGMAGGFLGSMLFNRLGFGGGAGGYAPMGGGGIGLLEILLLAGLGYLAYRFFTRNRRETPHGGADFYRASPPEPERMNPEDEEREATRVLERFDSNFDLNEFKDRRMDDFLKFQAAWNARDLNAVGNMIVPEFKSLLDGDIEELKSSKRINKLENIAVRGTDLLESWQEDGKLFATVQFRAQLLDYTIDEDTQNVVAGDRSRPVKFDEAWTFVKTTQVPNYDSQWKLTAVSTV